MMTYGDLVTNTEKLQIALEKNLKLLKHAASIKTLLEDERYEVDVIVKGKAADFDGDEEYETNGLFDKNEIKDIILKRVNDTYENARNSLMNLTGVSEPADKPLETADKTMEQADDQPGDSNISDEDHKKRGGKCAEQKISDRDLERAYFVDCKNARQIERETGESYWSLRRRLQEMREQKEQTAKECASSGQDQMER